MRLLTWNCQGGFRNKIDHISAFRPDIAVISECESPHKLGDAIGLDPAHFVWHGDDPGKKGVAVFSFTGYRLDILPFHNRAIKYCVPVRAHGPVNFSVLAVWTKAVATQRDSYVGQLHAAFDEYGDLIASTPMPIIGDLNSNQHFDRKRADRNHTAAMAWLAERGYASAYHTYFGEAHGQESQPTWFMYRKAAVAYHFDYVILPAMWLRSMAVVTVGDFAHWQAFSDHTPVIVDIDLGDAEQHQRK